LLLLSAVWLVLGRSRADSTKTATLAALVSRGTAAGYNVVLITLDTTRADHLGIYGYEKGDTSAIDSLLQHGFRFDDAVTSSPVTLPSHASILTGLDPYHHGARNNGSYFLGPEHVTLAEMVKAHGYETAAFVSTFVLDERFGLDQGFDVYDFEISDGGWHSLTSTASEREANLVSQAAIKWLKRRESSQRSDPFFMWIHYFDPHSLYKSPLAGSPPFEGTARETAYDAEIGFVDLHLRRVLSALDEQGLRDKTLIVLTCDHGESLGEHGEEEHGAFLYDATMRVALLFSCPSLFDRPYRVDDRVVGTVDIVPTVADLLGIDLTAPVDGVSLLGGAADPDRAIYMETLYTRENLGCAALFALRTHHAKFILAPRSEYYDLRRDPKELKDLWAPSASEGTALRDRLIARLAEQPDASAATRVMDANELEKLASLGYVDLGGAATSPDRIDPKDRVPLLVNLGRALELKRDGRYEEAVIAAKEVVDQSEGVYAPVLALGSIYRKMGRPNDAVRVMSDYVAKHPCTEMAIPLAELLRDLGRFAEMEQVLRTAEAIDPQCGAVPMLRGDRHYAEQDYRAALDAYRKAASIDGQRVGPQIRQRLLRAGQHVEEDSQ
jgi:arylsulfatase A-like enzyme